MRTLNATSSLISVFATMAMVLAPTVAAETAGRRAEPHRPEAQDFVHGRPEAPTEAWLLAAGGRIYDNWWDALDRKKPEATHPSYPASGQQSGAATWRCKECHGWDYKGRDGDYGKGSHATGIAGIRRASGSSVKKIMTLLRSPPHGYTEAMMSEDELSRIAAFVSRGQHDADRHIDRRTGKVRGDIEKGRGVFQTICAACHGFDGRLLNWGTREEPAYVGTEARKFPAEVLHKIRNSHPGAAMVNLRALPLRAAIDVLAFSQTLPAQ